MMPLLFFFGSNKMGWLSYPLRYYSGTAHAGEYVSLVREPNNPYDRNAIRVDNMHGQKVWPGNEGKTMENQNPLSHKRYHQSMCIGWSYQTRTSCRYGSHHGYH